MKSPLTAFKTTGEAVERVTTDLERHHRRLPWSPTRDSNPRANLLRWRILGPADRLRQLPGISPAIEHHVSR